MRIISGKYGGLSIETAKSQGIRPTTDRVREAMFSSILSMISTLDGVCVLDAFAGSGALSFEALSRGAKFAQMYEKNKLHAKIIANNAKKLKLSSDKYKINSYDVFKYNFSDDNCKTLFDIVFIDPPYAYKSADIFEFLTRTLSTILMSGAIVVYEHKYKSITKSDYNYICDSGFEIIKEKKYGDVELTYLRYKR